jgi:hypothetical protein
MTPQSQLISDKLVYDICPVNKFFFNTQNEEKTMLIQNFIVVKTCSHKSNK